MMANNRAEHNGTDPRKTTTAVRSLAAVVKHAADAGAGHACQVILIG